VKTVTTIREARDWRRAGGGSVGLVPTMGFLHAGHLSLVERARRENDRVAASLFVNPKQFGPSEDLARYPRDRARDTQLLEEAGCELLFAPDGLEMYPAGFETVVDVGSVSAPLEGGRRPGHFRGVATVVLKLFNILQPDRAYFGQKDAQQLAVIKKMTRDLDVPVEIVACPTVREEDGLAMSSRNVYLDADDRRAAPVLYRALSAARDRWTAGERDAEALRQAMRSILAAEPRARADYVSVADPETCRELDRVEDAALFSIAAAVGKARLIDNVVVGPDARVTGRSADPASR
jgi:pantoate--beta-alanine ligase